MDHICHQRIKDSFDKQGFMTLLGIQLETAERGKVVLSCCRGEHLTQQHGLLHAGVVSTLADVACGYTALTMMPPEYEVLSVEFKINFLRPVTAEKIIATGHVVKAGRSLVITEAEVCEAGTGKTVAKMLATMIPSPLQKFTHKTKSVDLFETISRKIDAPTSTQAVPHSLSKISKIS